MRQNYSIQIKYLTFQDLNFKEVLAINIYDLIITLPQNTIIIFNNCSVGNIHTNFKLMGYINKLERDYNIQVGFLNCT
jgi:hypothetical protein